MNGDHEVTNWSSCAIALGILLGARASGQEVNEYRVKAAFLYNFAKFVEWPPQAFKTPTDPIVIGVVGKSHFGGALSDEVSGKVLSGRAFLVVEVTSVREAASCQIVFVSSSERKRLAWWFAAIGTSGVLTVGETDNFVAEGGIINFKIDGGSVRFQVSMEAARKQRIRISSKLLSLAEIVEK